MLAPALVSPASSWIPGEPLSSPSLDATWAFLRLVLPDTVFAGSAREKGYVVFYRKEDPDGEPTTTTLRGEGPIRRYLTGVSTASLAENWFSVQSTQYSDRGRNTGDMTRHLPYIVLDLDGDRMAADLLDLRLTNFPAFLSRLDEALTNLGIACYYLMVSSRGGLHAYIPLMNSRTGQLLGANEKTLNDWKRTSDGLRLALEEFGTDNNAIRVTQPFVLPGLPRKKHAGFVPYFAGGRSGTRSDMYALLNTLVRLRYAQPEQRAHLAVHRPDGSSFLSRLLQEIAHMARGFRIGGKGNPARNVAAHRIATYLLAKGATEKQAWDAMLLWNQRNTPPLTEQELKKCLRSAASDKARKRKSKVWAQMAGAPWNKARAFLGLAPVTRRSFRPSRARSREERQRDHFTEVAERTLRYVRDQGSVIAKQAELADLLDTNRSTLRVVLKALLQAGRITLSTTRGRSGTTVIAFAHQPSVTPAPVEPYRPSNNVQSAPLNPDDGARVPASCVENRNQEEFARAGGGIGVVASLARVGPSVPEPGRERDMGDMSHGKAGKRLSVSSSSGLVAGSPDNAVKGRQRREDRVAIGKGASGPVRRRKSRERPSERFLRLGRAAGFLESAEINRKK